MGKIKIIELSDTERRKLNLGFVEGASHCYRMRCKVILLKSEGLSSKEIGNRVGMHPLSVDHWIHRYEQEGIPGLKTRRGRGRKPIMDIQDEAAVRNAIENDRQSVNKAREAWQKAVGKEASESTFKRFLSALAQDISE